MNEVRHDSVTHEKALYKAERTRTTVDQGPFVIHLNFPGYLVPGSTDHGHGPLALIAESILAPGTWIRLHEHVNDEIISWVPEGIMRHDDPVSGELITDPNHLMVMNAGRSFWHEERTQHDDAHLRMLQIFVRPHTLNLEPAIQHGPLVKAERNEWRHVFGPEGTEAPFSVRNDVHLYDIRLDAGQNVDMPLLPGWDTYFYIYTGEIEMLGTQFSEAESGLMADGTHASLTATMLTTMVVFLINPAATITRLGTVGR